MKNYALLEDPTLIERLKSGDEGAFSALFNKHKAKVFTSIYLFVRDRQIAEDLLQDTFIKALEKIQKGVYKENNKFLAWVQRIAHNLCVDQYRKGKRAPRTTFVENWVMGLNFSFDETEEDRIIRAEKCQQVQQMIDTLPEEQKEVVILRHYANLPFKEIAEITNVSINTALGRMRYALISMRKLMGVRAKPIPVFRLN